MTTPDEEPQPAGRRYHLWPAQVGMGVMILLGVWALLSVRWLIGVEPSGTQIRAGTAVVGTCEREPVKLWMTTACGATITWDDGKRSTTKDIVSTGRLEGTVHVVEAGTSGTSTSRHRTAVFPADHATWPLGFGTYLFLCLIAEAGFLYFGFSLGGRVARLLPEPRPKPEKVTKNWRGVDRSGVPKFNGPRRRKRKRG